MSTTGVFALLDPSGSDFAISGAGTILGQWITGFQGVKSMSAQLKLAYGSGGTTIDAYIQTSLDNGNTPIDIAAHRFLVAGDTKVWNFETDVSVGEFTPTDGAMASGSKQDGVLGDRFRLKVVVAGTYANTSLAGRVVTR